MMTERELATVLAALRFWQRHGPSRDDSLFDRLGIEEQDVLDAIRTDCGRLAPLDDSEIDALCGQLNASHDRDVDDAKADTRVESR